MLSARRTLTLFVVLCLGHVLLISSQVQAGMGQSALQVTAFGAVASVQNATAGAAGGISRIWSNYFALVGASRENESLRTRVVELEAQLQGEKARADQAAGLEGALNLQKSLVASTLSARVIAANPTPGSVPGVEPVTIDRGRDDGITANMAVISGRGVVGRVIGEPAAHASRVQLLVGHSAAAGAVLERTNTAGLVQGGFADGKLRMKYVSSAAPITIGDRVVTSGQDKIYPRGFLIGHVMEVKGAGKDREIVVVPAIDFSYIEVVLVVLNRAPQAAK
jgi:rod shape-determining protein MreC